MTINSFLISSLSIAFLLTGTVSSRSLWSSSPAGNSSDTIQSAYPLGNGRLGAMPFGPPGLEKLNLNLDSLWSGGPFANESYRGGNPSNPLYGNLAGVRETIWSKGSGSAASLQTPFPDYGSFQVLANLTINISGISGATNYRRELDFTTGIHTTTFTAGSAKYKISVYCSNPDDVCVYDIRSSRAVPDVTLYLEQTLEDPSLISTSCSNGVVKLNGTTAVDSGSGSKGMMYDVRAKTVGNGVSTSCKGNALVIPKVKGARQRTFVLAAGTNYNAINGNSAASYSFAGPDPGSYVQNAIDAGGAKGAVALASTHTSDYSGLAKQFVLNIPDTSNAAGTQTSDLIANYNNPDETGTGTPYLEAVMFDFARHLFISSGRENSLPPNLQGKWTTTQTADWGSDYHANINLQMNYWIAEETGLSELTNSLWDYMRYTWIPRGTETAKLLYNAPGWVTHDEMNIFGHTAMKQGDDFWANYPVAAAWMLQHVWDHYDFTQDEAWLSSQGYPMFLKPIAQFWSDQLQDDQYFKDGTLVANPCSSPEHGVTTFGCAHSQQLIHQLFIATLKAAAITGESNQTFVNEISSKLGAMDKGLHIGSWGQIQEWKIDQDKQNDTHRHLSHLVGWYPGYSLSSFEGGYTNATIQKALTTTLWSRGNGIAWDGNAGWPKVWRSACWARLNETERAYYELRLSIYQNSAPNGLSMAYGKGEPFQIDANFGFGGAVLSMLAVDLPQTHSDSSVRRVVLGPAIPSAWGNGSVKGMRLRGGSIVDFKWDANGLVTSAKITKQGQAVTVLNKSGKKLAG